MAFSAKLSLVTRLLNYRRHLVLKILRTFKIWRRVYRSAFEDKIDAGVATFLLAFSGLVGAGLLVSAVLNTIFPQRGDAVMGYVFGSLFLIAFLIGAFQIWYKITHAKSTSLMPAVYAAYKINPELQKVNMQIHAFEAEEVARTKRYQSLLDQKAFLEKDIRLQTIQKLKPVVNSKPAMYL